MCIYNVSDMSLLADFLGLVSAPGIKNLIIDSCTFDKDNMVLLYVAFPRFLAASGCKLETFALEGIFFEESYANEIEKALDMPGVKPTWKTMSGLYDPKMCAWDGRKEQSILPEAFHTFAV
jgi:hypothetical protein